MDKYLSVITNFGCHGKCPYCIVRENGIKVPKSTIDGLNELEEAIKLTGATILSVSGGGDPLHDYDKNPLVPMYNGMVMGICIKTGVPLEMHTSYIDTEYPYHFCKRVVYHLHNVSDLYKIIRHGSEIVRVVFVATAELTKEDIASISNMVHRSQNIDELSFRQMVDSNYHTTDYNSDYLKWGMKKGYGIILSKRITTSTMLRIEFTQSSRRLELTMAEQTCKHKFQLTCKSKMFGIKFCEMRLETGELLTYMPVPDGVRFCFGTIQRFYESAEGQKIIVERLGGR